MIEKYMGSGAKKIREYLKENSAIMTKEQIFDCIDEYMALRQKNYRIRVSYESERAFAIMMNGGEPITALKDEEYIINGITKRQLDKEKIEYEVID